GGTEVGDLADHRVAPLGNVAPVQGDHADQPVLLVPNAQLRREKLAAFAVRSRSRLQSGAADGFARNDNRAERPATLLVCFSLTRGVEMEAATSGFRFRRERPGAGSATGRIRPLRRVLPVPP